MRLQCAISLKIQLLVLLLVFVSVFLFLFLSNAPPPPPHPQAKVLILPQDLALGDPPPPLPLETSTITNTSSGWPCPASSNTESLSNRLSFTKWNSFVAREVRSSHNKFNFDLALTTLYDNLRLYHIPLNGIVIGACDGTRDGYIDFVRNHNNTSALLIEPVPHNFDDLVESFSEHNDNSRVQFARAAVDSTCTNENATRTFSFMSKEFEDNSPTARHWIRRQIGSMDPRTASILHERFGSNFKNTTVECLSPRGVVQSFLNLQVKLNSPMRRCYQNGTQKLILSESIQKRLSDFHILKIDAEGLDINIVTGFLDLVMCSSCQQEMSKLTPHGNPSANVVFNSSTLKPVMIVFEDKLVVKYEGEKAISPLKQRLESFGYHMALCGGGDQCAFRTIE